MGDYFIVQYRDDPAEPPVPVERPWPSYNLAQARADIHNATVPDVELMVYVVPRAFMWSRESVKADPR